ncbi:unnamed protein product [Blepharisma stoltei]|uniref:USP domain-containing protein n=1 Tax=Blepharisma stoltei TaxID=1481888 RepID=A0AAU9IIL2_9CILI|nr:unnamed protein product [Blepharisma stoltei]
MNEIDQKRLFNVVVNKNYSCSEGHIFPNTDLSFLIIVQPNSSIENALQDLYDEQNFDELWCQECGSLRKQARYVSSVEFPQYLIFYTPKNKRTNFSFPESLEIYGEAYSLYAIICHKQNILYGHYLAYVCLQGVWYKCDDSRVKKQAPDYKSAYLLFYQK